MWDLGVIFGGGGGGRGGGGCGSWAILMAVVWVGLRLYNSGSAFGRFAMSKANVDPDELRRFAMDLKRFTDEIQSLVGQLHSRMSGLESTWRDQEQKKFAEAFSQTAKALAGFVEAAGEHAMFLNKK